MGSTLDGATNALRAAAVEQADDDTVARHWQSLSSDFYRIAAALDRALQAEHDLSGSEFDVLERLVGEDDEGLRLADLADQVYLSQSALSRLVTRLENDGLVARHACTTDRRSVFASVTEAGRAAYLAAKPTQRTVLRSASAGCEVGALLCDEAVRSETTADAARSNGAG